MDISHGRHTEMRDTLTGLLGRVLDACEPGRLLAKHVRTEGSTLCIGDRRYDLEAYNRVLVVGAGKASASMVSRLEGLLGGRIDRGVVVVPDGYASPTDHVTVFEAAHPVPDERSVDAADRILRMCEEATDDDLVIALISGGGSALMAAPVEGVPLEDIQSTVDTLVKSGADIREINAVRKHLSRIKGGQLAQAISPASSATLILSDVIGNDLATIASGPTVPDPTSFADAMDVVERHGLTDALPARVVAYLRGGVDGRKPETPDADMLAPTHHVIIGDARTCAHATLAEVEVLGWTGEVLAAEVEGEAREVARVLAALGKEQTRRRRDHPVALIFAGETTVTVRGDGRGGRNQELALGAAIALDGVDDVWLVSLATDGTDGPTTAAGAMVDGETATRLRGAGISPRQYLNDNDAYSALDVVDELLITGPTNTNLNDLMLLVVG